MIAGVPATYLAPGWTPALRDRLIDVWRTWHLNGMKAGCIHQRAAGWQSCPGYHKEGEACPDPVGLPFPHAPENYAHEPGRHCRNDAISMPCPVCGYRFGTAWLHDPLPPEIIAEVCAWPSGGVEPGPNGEAPSPYDIQADAWLQRYGVRFEADHTASKAGIGDSSQHWTVTLRAPGVRPFVFDFWNSINDTQQGIPLRAYAVLSCLASDASMTDANEVMSDFGRADMAPSRARKIAAWGNRVARWLAQVEARTPGATEALAQIQ
jgi:hypothetical protein